jgi:hypothetical protein
MITDFIFLSLGFFLGFLVFVNVKPKLSQLSNKSPDYKTGIIKRTYTTGDGGSFSSQIEIQEIQVSNDRSKVKVLNIVNDQSKFNNEITKDNIKSTLENSWILSSEIEYIVKPDNKAEERSKKIDKILK